MTQTRIPRLLGLVFAGGQSRRMGQDKGTLSHNGTTQVERCVALLDPFCDAVKVSVRESQADLSPYCRLPLVFDDTSVEGPAAGILAAWSALPQYALLVLAVDMPFVDEVVLHELVSRRDSARFATAFGHPSGLLEPLCAIWEPAACAALAERVAAGDASPRRCLEALDVESLTCRDPNALRSIDSPADRDAVLRQLQRSS